MTRRTPTDDDPKGKRREARRLARKCAELPPTGPTVPSTYDGPGHSVIGVAVFGVGLKSRRRIATLGHSSGFYDPATNVAVMVANALDPEREENRVKRGTCRGDMTPAGIRVRGVLTGKETEYGVEVRVYQIDCWLKRKWVMDLGDGSLRIHRQAFIESRKLSWARTRHRRLIEGILRKRVQQ